MRLEVKDNYCTGNYAYIGGGKDWLDVDTLPSEDTQKLRAYKVVINKKGKVSFEFDEQKYETIKREISDKISIFNKKLEINELQEQLSLTNDKVIKCYEYSLLNKSLPYDLAALHATRQLIRDKIDLIENEIESLNN